MGNTIRSGDLVDDYGKSLLTPRMTIRSPNNLILHSMNACKCRRCRTLLE